MRNSSPGCLQSALRGQRTEVRRDARAAVDEFVSRPAWLKLIRFRVNFEKVVREGRKRVLQGGGARVEDGGVRAIDLRSVANGQRDDVM